MAMDKVASSPALAMAEGWPDEDNPLSENESAALSVALGVGMSVSANNDDAQERHTVADLASLVSATCDNNNGDESSPSPIQEVPPGTTPILRYHPTGNPKAISECSSMDSPGRSEDSESKIASFYIGDEQGCTRDLPPPTDLLTRPVSQPSSPRVLTQPPRRVKINDQGTKKKTVEFIPPDGGYGWVVAVAACLVNVWIVGFIKSFGVLYVPLRNAFPDASAYQASWLPALLSTLGLIIAPVTGLLCRRFTSRKVSFVGGIFCFLGLILGSQAVTMNQLILSTGLLTGLGAGLTTTPGVLITSLYFEKRRALASAICVSGNALGGFFLPPLVDYLLGSFGLRATLIILSAMQLHICAASMLYRPIHQHALIQAQEKSQKDEYDLAECPAPVPEDNKLLPNTPATPKIPNAAVASAPNTPLTRSKAIWNKVISRRRLTSVSTSAEDEELQRQVSFLRSSSMMNSIPDLTHYARSWSVSYDRTSLDSRSSIRLALGSKTSLSRLSFRTNSKSSIGGENRHATLHRLSSEEYDRCIKHPTLLRLASEEDSRVSSSRILTAPACMPHSHVVVPPKAETRTQLVRKTSCRKVQGRIMSSVQEQDNDSQLSDELEDQTHDKTGVRKEADPSEVLRLEISEVSERQERLIKEEPIQEEEPIKKISRPKRCFACFSSCMELDLFKNPLFVMMTLSIFFMASGAPHAAFFLPAYAGSVNIPSSQVPHMLSISSMVDLFGRLGIGFISDLGICKISHLYCLSCVAAGGAVLNVPRMTSFMELSGVFGVYGFGVGSWMVLIPTLLAQHHGAAKLASSYGVARLFHGLMNFISPQINGVLIDVTESYAYCYYYMGTLMVLAGCLLLLQPFLLSYTQKKTKQEQEKEQLAANDV